MEEFSVCGILLLGYTWEEDTFCVGRGTVVSLLCIQCLPGQKKSGNREVVARRQVKSRLRFVKLWEYCR